MTVVAREQEERTPAGGPPQPERAEDPQTQPSNPRRRALRLLVAFAVLAAGGLGALGYWYFYLRGVVRTDDARLAGHLVDLAPQISARLAEVPVREGQLVRRGEVIFRLDPGELAWDVQLDLP